MGCFGLFRQVKFSVRLQHSVRFLHNSEGNLIYGKSIQGECSENALVYFHCRAAVFCVLHNSKEMKILYDWRGMVRQEQNSLNYFGARYLDPMLGMWISVDPKRQFASPYLYAGNGMNPMNGVDEEGNDFMRTYWRYTPTKQYAAGFTIYYTGTPEKPGKEVGHWPSHSGGYGTAMKPGTYQVDSKNKRDVRHMNDGSRGWKSWAYVIYTEDGKELRGAEGSRVMFHNDDLDPPTKEIPARGTTHGCHGILDESSNSDELKPEGNLPELLKNADERMVPLIVEEF